MLKVVPRKLITLMNRRVFYGDVGRENSLLRPAEVDAPTRQVGTALRTAVDQFDRIKTDVRSLHPLDGLIRIGPPATAGTDLAVRSVNEQALYYPMTALTYDGTPKPNPFAWVSLYFPYRAGRTGYVKVQPLFAFGIDAAPHAKYLAVAKAVRSGLDGTGTNRLGTFRCVALAVTGIERDSGEGGLGNKQHS